MSSLLTGRGRPRSRLRPPRPIRRPQHLGHKSLEAVRCLRRRQGLRPHQASGLRIGRHLPRRPTGPRSLAASPRKRPSCPRLRLPTKPKYLGHSQARAAPHRRRRQRAGRRYLGVHPPYPPQSPVPGPLVRREFSAARRLQPAPHPRLQLSRVRQRQAGLRFLAVRRLRRVQPPLPSAPRRQRQHRAVPRCLALPAATQGHLPLGPVGLERKSSGGRWLRSRLLRARPWRPEHRFSAEPRASRPRHPHPRVERVPVAPAQRGRPQHPQAVRPRSWYRLGGEKRLAQEWTAACCLSASPRQWRRRRQQARPESPRLAQCRPSGRVREV